MLLGNKEYSGIAAKERDFREQGVCTGPDRPAIVAQVRREDRDPLKE